MSEASEKMQSGFREYYDLRWSKENQRETPPNPERVELVCQAVRAALRDADSDARILEVGCGNGWILQHLAELLTGDQSLIGIEPSASGVENARRRCPSAHVECTTLEDCDLSGFDVVVCSEVLEHVEDQKQFCRQLAERLNPGGEIVLTTPNGLYRQTYFELNTQTKPQPIERWVTSAELQTLFRELQMQVALTTFDLSMDSRLRSPTLLSRLGRRLPGMLQNWCIALDERRRTARFHKGLYLLARIQKNP